MTATSDMQKALKDHQMNNIERIVKGYKNGDIGITDPNGFDGTTFLVEPLTEEGKRLLGFGIHSMMIRKSAFAQ